MVLKPFAFFIVFIYWTLFSGCAGTAAPEPEPEPVEQGAIPSEPVEESTEDKPRMEPETLAALVEVRDGSQSIGSGFVADWNEKTFIFTNMHVLSGNRHPKFVLSDGRQIQPKNVFGAVGHDVAILEIDSPGVGLELADSSELHSWYERNVLVPGNSLGGGVFRAITGKITAVGSELIEIDARFVSGNSGSPIIVFPERKVVGIATYTRTLRLTGRDRLSKFEATRWFGYRLDSIQSWQILDGRTFLMEAELLAEGEERLSEWTSYLLGQGSGVHQRLARDFRRIEDDYNLRSALDGRPIPGRARRGVAAVRKLFLEDTNSLTGFFRYDYHEQRAVELRKARQAISDYLRPERFQGSGTRSNVTPSAGSHDPFAPPPS